jgi:hypothetical protein
MRVNKFLWLTVSLSVVVALAVGLGVALLLHSRSQDPQRATLSANSHSAARTEIGSSPTCPPATGPLPTMISIAAGTAGDTFDRSCYYAAARQPLTIRFTNSIYASLSNAPTSLTLLISPSEDPAIAPVPGSPMFSTIDGSKAVFTGVPVIAPQAGVMSVPALPAGNYDLQILEMPTNFLATLVVQ